MLMNGFMPLWKGPRGLSCLFFTTRIQRDVMQSAIRRQAFTRAQTWWYPDLWVPASRTVRNLLCCLQASKSLVFCYSSLNGWRYPVILGVWAKVCISYKLNMWIKCPLDPFILITMKQACLVPGGGEQGGELPVGSESTIEDTGGVGVEGEVKAEWRKHMQWLGIFQHKYLKEVGIASSNQLKPDHSSL